MTKAASVAVSGDAAMRRRGLSKYKGIQSATSPLLPPACESKLARLTQCTLLMPDLSPPGHRVCGVAFRMASAASAPQEILERIFRHAASGALDVPSKSWRLRHFPNNKATKAISQVPLVNQHWNEAATRVLYWELVVIELPREGVFAIPSRNALLTRTLEGSPRLRAHVRSLCLNTWTMDMNDREKSEGLSLRIFRCCPLVQHVWIHGWIPSLLDKIRSTIATFIGLRFLSIHSFIGYNDPFCSFETLETMMKGWPKLEYLNIGGQVVTDDGGDSVQSTRNLPVNKHFTRLTLFDVNRLEGFTRITPNLVELSLWIGGDPEPFLLHAQRWKHTLRCLKIWVRSATTDTQWRAEIVALCGFEKLQRLRIRNLFPLTLLELPDTLEKIKFTVRSTDLPILFDVLDQKLPHSIRTVTFGVDYPHASTKNAQRDLESELRAFCEKRKWKWLVYHPYRYRISTS
jgi:hypothetical protein